MVKKKTDVALEIIERIMAESVPAEGELHHPYANKTAGGQRQATIAEFKEHNRLPDDVASWTNKHFVDYLCVILEQKTGIRQRKTYAADVPIVVQIGKTLASNGLERHQWTKTFLEWAVGKYDFIVKNYQYFTFNTVMRTINIFLQEAVLPQLEDGTVERELCDTSLLDEIKDADSTPGKGTEILARFGIPVAFTFFVKLRGVSLEKLCLMVDGKFKTLANEDPDMLKRIFMSSLIGSPYPPEFVLRDWRDRFAIYANIYQNEAWWREEDYKGKPLPKYAAFLSAKKGTV